VHVTEVGGVEWRAVHQGLPGDRWVSRVESSRVDPKVAFVSLNGYRDDDPAPYLYKTVDGGTSWTSLSAGLPAEPINVIREDPVQPKVLYVGSDRGAYVSLDAGQNWQALAGGLPKVPVHDMVVHPRERELVAATHGRSMWVLDVLPIQELSDELREQAVHVFPLEDRQASRGWRSRRSPWFFREVNQPTMEIPFWAREAGSVEFSVRDSDGRALRTESLEVIPGLNQYSYDLMLDPDLALPAERERIEAQQAEDDASEESESEDGAKVGGKDRPWAEAVRLERPLFISAGEYHIRIAAGETEHEVSWKVKAPKPREKRVKPEPKIRGEDDDSP
jgi:hypothetical protein